MAMTLVEGETFADHFTLLEKIAESPADESWLAVNDSTGDRTLLKIYLDLSDEQWASVTRSIDATRGLVHENINRITEYGTDGDTKFTAEPYLKGAEQFSPSTHPQAEIWQILKQLISALQYAHHSGIAHGHLHPGNLIVDNTRRIHITGFGAPSLPKNKGRFGRYLSPQIQSGHTPDVTDDIYSLGSLAFTCLTGKEWQPDVQLDQPLPTRIEALLSSMLDPTPYERTVELFDIEASLAEHFESSDQTIPSVEFEREVPGVRTPTETGPVVTRQQHQVSTTQVGVGLVVLIVLALGLFMLLPDSVERPAVEVSSTETPQTQAETTSTPTEPVRQEVAPFEAAQLEFMREEGTKLAREILKKQIQLEDMGVFVWSEPDFTALTEKLNGADELFRVSKFEAALERYREIDDSLTTLIDESQNVLAEQLQIGDEALITGDAETALRAFTIANAIDRNNDSIESRLNRAENLETVVSLMREGEMAERNEEFESALAKYSEAYALDGEWTEASEGVARMRTAITQARFNAAMSDAFTALASKNYEASREGFYRAQDILPSSAEPADGLLQVDQAIRTDNINQHRENAEQHAARSEWAHAIGEYEAALAIDPTLVFATEGLEQSTFRKELDEQLTRFLADPSLMQDDDELREARKTLATASRTEPKSAEMLDYLDTLARLISGARIEVPVTINSDNKTDVTILKVANLGRVSSDVLRLIPGRYTITGERRGYRDVRVDLTIIAGTPVPPIEIACTEKI